LGGVLKENRFNGSYSVSPLDETNEYINQIEQIYKGLNTSEQAEQLAANKG
jgi:hypothetical protein